MTPQQRSQLEARHRVPAELYNVEAAAQKLFYYLKVHAEDTTALARDPTARDRAYAKCASGDGVRRPAPGSSIIGPEQIVPVDGDVDGYLAEMHVVIDKPAFTPEQRVMRIFCVWSALEVFRHYKINLALLNDHKIQKQVMDRVDRLFTAYLSEVQGQSGSSVPPADRQGESLKLLEGEVQDLLSQPELLCGLHFKRSEGAQSESTWRVVSFAGTERGTEYKVSCEGDSTIMMNRDELTDLLRTSTFT